MMEYVENESFFISDFVNQLRDQVASAWSRVPIQRPNFNIWPEDVQKNGNTTSTVKVSSSLLLP